MEAKTELQRNAIVEARRKELETYQRALDIQWLNGRMEDGRMGRCLALIQKESEMEKDFQERTDHAAIVNARANKETALGIEIAKVRREEASELLRRHHLRERDPSLRQLLTKLQAGYVCRDLRQQILHNEYKKLQYKIEQDNANRALLGYLYNAHEAKEQEEKNKMEKNRQYCNDLQQQLVNRQLQKQCLYEEMLIEKKMLEEVARTIADEDQRELRHNHKQTEQLRNEMIMFKKASNAWKEKQKAMIVIEERQIEEQRKAASDRSSAILAERERKLREREKINQKISNKILADEEARQERDNLIKLLQEQEYLEKNVQDDARGRDNTVRVKRDTKQALTEQMETKKRMEREQRVREAEFRKSLEAKMAKDDERENEKERRNKEKREKYSQELRKQIQDNAVIRKRNRDAEDNRAKYVWQCNKAWDKEVAEEREKIIEEHVPHLLGHLQAGVLHRSDLAATRAGANGHQQLAELDIESMAISNRAKRHAKCNPQCQILRNY